MGPDNRDERIARRAAEIALAMLAAAVATPTATEYSTHRVGSRPEGYGLRRWQKLCPTLPGARRRGRFWVVARADFDRWEAATHEPKPPPRQHVEPPTDLAAFAASLGRRAGGRR